MDSPCVNTVVVNMRVIPIPAHAGITGFESPAAEYGQLAMSLDDLLVGHLICSQNCFLPASFI